MQKRVLFAISSLGLGHATRSLVIINYLISKKYNISILSYGNALTFLMDELKEKKNIDFIKLEDYPPLERGRGLMMYLYLIYDIFIAYLVMRKERKFMKMMYKKYDLIFSDGRYGIYHKKVKSFIISHQISFIMPRGLGAFKFISDYINYKVFNKFNSVLIPDFKNEEINLAGKLSHTDLLKRLNHKYIGLLSSYNDNNNGKKDIDYLFIISGYLKEHKESFVNTLLNEAKNLDGKKVFVLGDTTKNYKKNLKEFDITIYSFVSGEVRNKLFENSEVVISRAGYTTIMDLVKLGKKAILFPTPNQTEQEYLAKHLGKKGYFIIGDQEKDINLKKLIKKLSDVKKFETNDKTFENTIKEIIN
nr:glycosyltransferase [Candidatus Gracilibacteria bacterium]